ncbi:RNA polymerase sigma factor [Bradyrhizobium australiense]|uniref:RNA polymerase sigma factor n=1 Tax=Bradyrhizobium australiense TaxID=2721161 RepID=A0A7Y4GUZ6_9BRAD|nr:RNA polymerase sigma factor [Bradyrhizobium australiense]NOJ42381.1 RNA polymerase sigma factor [Bradyrhizobium australiense]
MTALAGARRCDPLLIEAARSGDADALVALIAIAQPDIRRYAARNCRAADIDDAVQETLLLLYRRVGTLRAVTSFSAWLFAVARRACLRLLRRAAGGAEAPADDAEARLAHRAPEDIRIDLSRAIQSLPDHYREVILLRDIEELSIDDIVGVLGLTRESVKARIHRARIMIREYLIRD